MLLSARYLISFADILRYFSTSIKVSLYFQTLVCEDLSSTTPRSRRSFLPCRGTTKCPCGMSKQAHASVPCGRATRLRSLRPRPPGIGSTASAREAAAVTATRTCWRPERTCEYDIGIWTMRRIRRSLSAPRQTHRTVRPSGGIIRRS